MLKRLLRVMTAVVVAVGLAGVTPAGAFRQEGIEVTKDQTAEREYGPIAVSGGNASSRTRTPSFCENSAACDVIPLKIVVPPDLAEHEEFFVRVVLSWEQTDGPLGTSSSDLDMYVYDDYDAGPSDVIASGSSTANPEIASLERPRKGEYWVAVANFAGANNGYTLQARWMTGQIPTVYEDLGPQRRDDDTGGEDDDYEPPVDRSGDRADTTKEYVPPASVEPLPSPEPVSPLAGSDEFAFGPTDSVTGAPSSVGGDFEPAGSDLFSARPAAILGRAEPVPAPVLFFWLLMVPFALVAGAGFWLWRHRPVALTAT